MFITTVLTLATTAMVNPANRPGCAAGADLVPSRGSYGFRTVAPDVADIRRVWALLVISEKEKGSEKKKEARVATRIEDLSAALTELADTQDADRGAELELRVLAIIDRLRADLDIDPPPPAEPPAAATLARIKDLLERPGGRRHERRRALQMLDDLRRLLATKEERAHAADAEPTFRRIFESSRAQMAARTDHADACSSVPSRVKDFKRYFAEMHDLFVTAGQEVPVEVKEALSTLEMRPRIVAQLLPSMVLDGKASVVQAAAQIQWRTRYQRILGSLEFNSDGGIGYGPTVVVLNPEGAPQIKEEETIVTTTDASGETRQTRTVTASGSYSCKFSPTETTTPSEVCLPPDAGQPRLGLQNAFQWHLGMQLGWGLQAGGRAGEIRAFGRAQMTNPTAAFKIAEDKGKDTGSTSLASIDGEARWAFETGVRVAIYDRGRQEAREHSGLRPAMSFAYGHRWDKRLAGASIEGAGARSERRQFLRLALTRVPVFDDNGDVFNLTVGIDREWASWYGRKENNLPGVTRMFIQANIDFLKAFGKE